MSAREGDGQADGERAQQGPLRDELLTGTADKARSRAADPKKQARFHLAVIAPGETRFDFRALDDVKPATGKKKRPPKVFVDKTLDEVWSELQRWNRQRYGIFVVVNKTDGKGQSTENVIGVRAIFADCDGVDPQPLIDALKPIWLSTRRRTSSIFIGVLLTALLSSSSRR